MKLYLTAIIFFLIFTLLPFASDAFDINDINTFRNCFGKVITVSCQHYDFNGDSIIGVPDYAALLSIIRNSEILSRVKIVFVGDSITEGIGTANPLSESYPALIASQFGVESVNAGCSGATLRDFMYDLPSFGCKLANAWVLNVKPNLPSDYAHVLFGANDALGSFEYMNYYIKGAKSLQGRFISEYEFAGLATSLVDRFVDAGTHYVFISIEPSLHSSYSLVFNGDGEDSVTEIFEKYVPMIVDVIEKNPKACFGIDMRTLLTYPDDYADIIHPNAQGHQKIANALGLRINYVRTASTQTEFMQRCKELPVGL